MGPTILALMPFAIVSMLLPLWLVIEVRLLGSHRGLAKAVALVAGMTAVRLVQGVVFALVAGRIEPGDPATAEQEAHWFVSAVLVVLGVVLIVAGVRLLLGDHDPDAAPPRWMQWVDSMGVGKTAGFGAGLVAVNSKSWIFTLGALGTIVEADLSVGEQIGAYLVFVVAAQALLIGLILVRLCLPARSASWLATLSTWLETHSTTISVTVALLFGTIFLIKGVTGLL